MSKTKYVKMTGFLEYARVFPENMDNWEGHAETKGQFNVNFYPESEEEMNKYFEAGAPKSTMGHDTFKEGNEFGIGVFTKLKRPNIHLRFDNWRSAPDVFDFRDGPSTKEWSMEEDGELGNGTKAIVKVGVYGDGPRAIKTLEAVAVLEHVPYEREAAEEGGKFF